MIDAISEIKPDANGIRKFNFLATETPLEPMHRLGDYIGLSNLYVKRDDEGGRGGGGNKIRKFERQFAKMVDDGHDTVIIAAHPQSNAARELVGTAARFGLKSVVAVKDLIGRKTAAFGDNGNRLLLDILGAKLVDVPADDDFVNFINKLAHRLRGEGSSPFILPFGASELGRVVHWKRLLFFCCFTDDTI